MLHRFHGPIPIDVASLPVIPLKPPQGVGRLIRILLAEPYPLLKIEDAVGLCIGWQRFVDRSRVLLEGKRGGPLTPLDDRFRFNRAILRVATEAPLYLERGGFAPSIALPCLSRREWLAIVRTRYTEWCRDVLWPAVHAKEPLSPDSREGRLVVNLKVLWHLADRVRFEDLMRDAAKAAREARRAGRREISVGDVWAKVVDRTVGATVPDAGIYRETSEGRLGWNWRKLADYFRPRAEELLVRPAADFRETDEPDLVEHAEDAKGLSPSDRAAAREARRRLLDEIRILRRDRADPAGWPTLRYLLGTWGYRRRLSRRQTERRYGVTPKKLRCREARVRRRILAVLGPAVA